MIFEPLTLLVLGFFLLIAIIDLKTKAVPSVILSGLMLIVAVMNIPNVPYAIMSGIFALILWDLDTKRGIADTKATVIIGFMIASLQSLAVFMIVLVLYQVIYTYAVRYILKYTGGDFPLLPVYFLVLLTLVLGGFV